MRGPIPGFRGHLFTTLLAVAAAAVVLFVFLDGSRGLPTFSSSYQAKALLPTASALAPGARVTEAGVAVGHVVSVTEDGKDALVRFTLDSAHSPLPVDSRAALTLDTPLGEKTLGIVPGSSSRMLPPGGILTAQEAGDFVDVDQILSVLHGQTRTRARQALQSLGIGLRGRSTQLNGLLEGTSEMVIDGTPVVHTLADNHTQVADVVSNLARISGEIGARGRSLVSVSRDLTTTFRALSNRDAAIRSTLRQLPATLSRIASTTDVLGRTTTVVLPIVGQLTKAVGALLPTVHRLGPAAREGTIVVDDLRPAAPLLTTTLTALQHFSRPAAAALPPVGRALCQLNPLVRYVAPYGSDLGAMFENLGSVVNDYDVNGHTARLGFGVGPNSLYGVLPANVTNALDTLEQSGLFAKVTELGYDPYPPAGQANNTTIGRGVAGPAGDTQPYPHVTADC